MNLELSLLKIVLRDEDVSYADYLFSDIRLELYTTLKQYYSKYDKLPNADTLKKYIEENDKSDDILACYISIDIAKDYDKEYLRDKLYEEYILRKLETENRKLTGAINGGSDIKESFNRYVNDLLIVDDGQEIERGYVWESAKDRWKEYKQKEDGEIEKHPSYHINCLDKNLIGCVPSTAICYVASPGVGKTTICLNVAYNVARFEGKDVMYISGELKKSQLEIILDARDSLVDSMLIRAGSLSNKLREKYLESLKNQWKRKDKFYIVEAPLDFTIANVISYIHQYKKEYGKVPELIVIDYLWLMGDEEGGKTLPEKLGNNSKGLRHKVAKRYGTCVHYSTQESRGGQLKKADGKKRSMESIGDSNKIAPHCHAIIMLDDFKSSDNLELRNKLRLSCVKNTLGPTFEEDLWYLREYSYIGDSNLGMIQIPHYTEKKKEKKEKKKEEENEFKFEDI